jgi:hypothetical protein
MVKSLPWTKHVIIALWKYSQSLWKFRNGVKYGHTAEEAKTKELAHLQQQVTHEFELYEEDPFLISPQFRSLFTNKDLPTRLQMGRDALSSRLRSVKEAKRHQENFRASLTKIKGTSLGQSHANTAGNLTIT